MVLIIEICMIKRKILWAILPLLIFVACTQSKLDEKGFQVSTVETENDEENEGTSGINRDSLKFETRPGNVLLTGIENVRITTVYKVNINKKHGTTFIGTNKFLYDDNEPTLNNNWNGNIVPGLEAVYGYNLVNVSHYDFITNIKKEFFEKPVLVKTIYYPAFSKDTLNSAPVSRNYFLVSAYNDDTNKDGFINQRDLRRFYLFNILGEKQGPLVPENYSVYKSDYDSGNDFMFVFARLDNNANGQIEDNEPIHIYWIDLKDPSKRGRLY